MKKLFGLLLALAMLLSMIPAGFAAEIEIVEFDETSAEEVILADEPETAIEEEYSALKPEPDEASEIKIVPAEAEPEPAPGAERSAAQRAIEELSAEEDESNPDVEPSAGLQWIPPGKDKATQIDLGDSVTVTISQVNDYAWYYFVPEETAYYCFTSEGTITCSGTLYDEDTKELIRDSGSGGTGCFRLDWSMTAGHTYYLTVKLGRAGSTTLSLSLTPMSGSCADDVNWSYSEGLLQISGNGAMSYAGNPPWQFCFQEAERVELGDGITTIGQKAFAGFVKLSNLQMPQTLELIDRDAFRESGLIELSIPGNVYAIGDRAFDSCAYLRSVKLPDNLTDIGQYAFSQCSALLKVVFPDTLHSLGNNAFSSCSSLKEMVFLGDAPSGLIDALPQMTTVFYPMDGAGWPEAVAESTQKTIDWVAYSDLDNALTNYETVFPGGVSSGGTYAFPENTIAYDSTVNPFRMIPHEASGGIYFFYQDQLFFLKLEDGTYRRVYTAPLGTQCCTNGDAVYFLCNGAVISFDMNTQAVGEPVQLGNFDTVAAFAADEAGRYYIISGESEYRLAIYSSQGQMLGSCVSEQLIPYFAGFQTNENRFFYEYDAPDERYGSGLQVGVGELRDGEIVLESLEQSLGLESGTCKSMAFCPGQYNSHQRNAELMGGRYLVMSSQLVGKTQVLDLETSDLWEYPRPRCRYMDNASYDSVGTRAVYFPENDSLVFFTDYDDLSDCSADGKLRNAGYVPSHPVFDMHRMGDLMVLLERDADGFYLELVNYCLPEQISLAGEHTMSVTGQQYLRPVGNFDYTPICRWSSSDERVAIVSENGGVTAICEGEVEIAAEMYGGRYRAVFPLTVQHTELSSPDQPCLVLDAMSSCNVSRNDYSVWSAVMNSALKEEADGTLTRVELISDAGVVIERWTSDGQVLSQHILEPELPLYGGCFFGDDANYLVFGQENSKEGNNQTEVLRVVKYSGSWERLAGASVFGANTSVPFKAGSLRMAESDGRLYIHTCHEMYQDGSGVSHQANMSFVIDVENMSVVDACYGVLSEKNGYVSHSFNQFVETDDQYLFRVDQGDTYPRAIVLHRVEKDKRIIEGNYVQLVKLFFYGGGNDTGSSVGGMALTKDRVLIAGNCVDPDVYRHYSSNAQRNIFLAGVNKNFSDSSFLWLTDYQEDEGITPRTPQLVKLSDELFLLLWEEYHRADYTVTLRAALISASGKLYMRSGPLPMRLSDCQPIFTSDRLVKWYVTENGSPVLYALNPFHISCEGYLVHVDGQTPDCEHAGQKEYWCCSVCGKLYADVDAASALSMENLLLPATGHSYDRPVWNWDEDYSSATASFSCTRCGDTQTVDAAVSSGTTPADCQTDGTVTYTATAVFEALTYTDTKSVPIPALGHDWAAPTYVWADDLSTATASRVCKNDASHVETETVDTTNEITTPASCEAEGVRTYTASFTNPAFAAQTRTEAIQATGHIPGEPVRENEVAATCETEGGYDTVVYCTVCGKEQSREHTVIPSLGHDWAAPTYVWADDLSTVTATRICRNDASHVETETVDTTNEVTTPASCEAEGVRTYTASFTNPAFAAQTRTEAIPATGHDWAAPTYEWADDNSTVTATRVCRNGDHPETETVNTSYEVIAEPTEEAEGLGRYTAVFENPAFETQTKDVSIEKLSPVGHSVTVDQKYVTVKGEAIAWTDLDPDALYSGEVDFTVGSKNDQAVLAAVKNGDSYTLLECITDENGVHRFTVNVTEDTELVLAFKGDVDLNGEVKLKDNLMVKKHIARSELITDPLARLVADTDGNGEIKLKDNLMIKKHIAKSQMLEW